jgi:hypothetical protein
MLILVTAVLSGLLVPLITDQWTKREKAVQTQRADREKALAIKTSLVREIGTASADFLASADTVRLQDARALDRPYRSFARSSYDIASQIAAYFDSKEQPSLQQRWTNFGFSIRNAYQLFSAPPGRARNLWVARLSAYFAIPSTIIDGLCSAAGKDVFESARRILVLRFQQREGVIVDAAVNGVVQLGNGSDVSANFGGGSAPWTTSKHDPHPCNPYFKT